MSNWLILPGQWEGKQRCNLAGVTGGNKFSRVKVEFIKAVKNASLGKICESIAIP